MVDIMENVAVFTKDLADEQKKEMIDYVKCSHSFSGEYQEEKSLLEDAVKRIVERYEKSINVIDKGKFDCVLIRDRDSLSEEIKEELEDLVIKIIIFKKQMQIKEDRKEYRENDGMEVDVSDEGDYKKIEPL